MLFRLKASQLSLEQSPWQNPKHRPCPTQTNTLYSPMWNLYLPPTKAGLTSRTWPCGDEFRIRPLNEDTVRSPQFQFLVPSYPVTDLTKVPIRPQNERPSSSIRSGTPKPRTFSDGASLRPVLVFRFCTGAESDSNGRAHLDAIVELGNKCVSKWDAQ